MASPDSREATVFDLTARAERYERSGIRSRRLLVLAIAGLGVAMAVGGIWLNVSWAGSLLGQRLFGAETLLIGGLLIATVGLVYYRRIPHAATRLTLDEGGLHFQDIEGRNSHLAWTDPKARIDILDWRAIPVAARSRGLREVDFVLAPNLPVEADLPIEVVDAVFDSARAHGYGIHGWVEHPTQPGPQRIIRIRPGRTA
jgi:hypothetical protein